MAAEDFDPGATFFPVQPTVWLKNQNISCVISFTCFVDIRYLFAVFNFYSLWKNKLFLLNLDPLISFLFKLAPFHFLFI